MKLSIIIPVYLAYDNILEKFQILIDELVRQRERYPDTEIICVDDESPLQPRYPECVKVIRKKNAGGSAARNTGLDACTGEWITFLDDDDFISPEYLETIHRYLREKYEYISWDWEFNDGSPSRQYTPGYRNNVVWGYAWRRDIIGDKRFDTSLKYCEDIDFVMRTVNRDRMHKDLPDVLVIYFWFGNETSYAHRYLRGEIK